MYRGEMKISNLREYPVKSGPIWKAGKMFRILDNPV